MPKTTFKSLSVLSHPQLTDEKIKVYMKLNVFFFFFLFGEIQTYPAFFFLKTKLTGVKLLYSVMLVSAVQQSEPVISVHIFPHLKPPPCPNYLTPPGHHRAWS